MPALVVKNAAPCANRVWADITRTWPSGDASPEQTRLYGALLDARDAGLAHARPGASACEVDHAVRSVMSTAGYGDAFRTATGHGVGFGAIDHSVPPQIHPRSDTKLEVGIVFNIEPGAYVDRVTGARHCDMVAILDDGTASDFVLNTDRVWSHKTATRSSATDVDDTRLAVR